MKKIAIGKRSLSKVASCDLEWLISNHKLEAATEAAAIKKLEGRKESGVVKHQSRWVSRYGAPIVQRDEDNYDPCVLFDQADSLIKSFGGKLTKKSSSGSTYYELPDGRIIRVADHAPTDATADWLDYNDSLQVRIDCRFDYKWRATMATLEFFCEEEEDL